MEWQSYYVFLLASDGREFHFENETIAIADGKDHITAFAFQSVVAGCRYDDGTRDSGGGRRSHSVCSHPRITPFSPHHGQRHTISNTSGRSSAMISPRQRLRPGRRMHQTFVWESPAETWSVAQATIDVKNIAQFRAGPGMSARSSVSSLR